MYEDFYINENEYKEAVNSEINLNLNGIYKNENSDILLLISSM